MTSQRIGSLAELKYLGPQNLLKLIERWMRRSSEVLVLWVPPQTDSFCTYCSFSCPCSLPLLLFSLSHPDWQLPLLTSSRPVSVLLVASSCSPVPLHLSILLHSCCRITPTLQNPGNPWGFLPSAEVPATAIDTSLTSTSSAPGLLLRTFRSVQLRKALKVTECFHYKTEGTEVLTHHLHLIFQSIEDYCHRVGILDPGHFCWNQDS